MSGMGYIVIGSVILIAGTLGFTGLQLLLWVKKRRIREQYQIYD